MKQVFDGLTILVNIMIIFNIYVKQGYTVRRVFNSHPQKAKPTYFIIDRVYLQVISRKKTPRVQRLYSGV